MLGCVCKLPRPTRSLRPCGPRSLLEGGALPKRHCAPQPLAWTRPGFLFASTMWPAGRSSAATRLPEPCRGLSRRFNSRCSHALSPNGERESNPFAVVVPGCRARRRGRRATDAGLLAASTVPDLCEGSSTRDTEVKRANSCGFPCFATRFLSALPLASLALEDGGSALPYAEISHPGCPSGGGERL